MQTENKMAVMPVGRLICQMSAPPLTSMFLQYSYNMIDSAFVAQLSESALTAVSLSFPISLFERRKGATWTRSPSQFPPIARPLRPASSAPPFYMVEGGTPNHINCFLAVSGAPSISYSLLGKGL